MTSFRILLGGWPWEKSCSVSNIQSLSLCLITKAIISRTATISSSRETAEYHSLNPSPKITTYIPDEPMPRAITWSHNHRQSVEPQPGATYLGLQLKTTFWNHSCSTESPLTKAWKNYLGPQLRANSWNHNLDQKPRLTSWNYMLKQHDSTPWYQ